VGGHELAMSLRAAYLAMHRRTGAALARTGVTADQFVVLAALSEDDALTQRALVSRTASDPNTVRAMLVLLEHRGLIKRRPHPSDGRARSVALTQKGRIVLRRLWRESECLRLALVTALSAGEATALVDQLRRIAKALEPNPTARPKSGNRLPARVTT
jgi:DNA-binding MarR family transcriptional regulator